MVCIYLPLTVLLLTILYHLWYSNILRISNVLSAFVYIASSTRKALCLFSLSLSNSYSVIKIQRGHSIFPEDLDWVKYIPLYFCITLYTGPMWHLIYYNARIRSSAYLLWTLRSSVEKNYIFFNFWHPASGAVPVVIRGLQNFYKWMNFWLGWWPSLGVHMLSQSTRCFSLMSKLFGRKLYSQFGWYLVVFV